MLYTQQSLTSTKCYDHRIVVMCKVHIQPKVKPLTEGNVFKVKSDTGTSKSLSLAAEMKEIVRQGDKQKRRKNN